jgi:mannose-6-phosphate isomerase-like protein (cupin superfamily)
VAIVINRAELADSSRSYLFNGRQHGNTSVSFIHVELPSGEGPLLHRHAYDEIFVLLEGSATFTVGEETVNAVAGDVVVGPANIPHKFVSNGPGVLRQVDIHATETILTEWLED